MIAFQEDVDTLKQKLHEYVNNGFLVPDARGIMLISSGTMRRQSWFTIASYPTCNKMKVMQDSSIG